MIFAKDDITEIYVATFNRAPDAAGLNYWMYDSGFDSIDDIASSFFDSTEAQDIYSNSTSSQMVELAYQNLFGRSADADGLEYWTNELDSGSFSQSLMLQAMLNGAQGEDASVIINKTAVGVNYADRGVSDVDYATNVMSNISGDYTSVEDAYGFMDTMTFSQYNLQGESNQYDYMDYEDEMSGSFGDFGSGMSSGGFGRMSGGFISIEYNNPESNDIFIA